MNKSCFLFFIFILGISLSFVNVDAVEPESFLYTELSTIYGLRGDTLDITLRTDQPDARVIIFDPLDQVVYNQTFNRDQTRTIPISQNALYGTYKIQATKDGSISQTLYTVLDITNWTIVDQFPYARTHNNIKYVFLGNWTLIVICQEDRLSIDFSFLRSIISQYDLDVSIRENDMNLLVTLSKGNNKIHWNCAFIHKGLKTVINGSLQNSMTATFRVNAKHLKNILQGVRSGGLVFDWSDMKQAYSNLEYNPFTQILSVNIPKNFQLDPYVFSNGFEDGYLSWDSTHTTGSGIIGISQDWAKYGLNSSYADSGNPPSGGAKAYVIKSYSAERDIYCFFFVNVSIANTGYGSHFVELAGSAGLNVKLGYGSASGNTRPLKLTYYNGSYQYLTSNTNLTIGEEYRVQLRFFAGDSSDGIIQVWVDTVEILDLGATGFTRDNRNTVVRLGHVSSIYGYQQANYIDHVIIDTSYIVLPSQPPDNISCIITNIESGNDLYVMERYYIFQVVVLEQDEPFENLTLSFTDDTYYANFTFSVSSQTWNRTSGYEITHFDESTCSNSSLGSFHTMNFLIKLKTGIEERQDRDIYLMSVDDLGNSSGWENINADYFNIVYSDIDMIEFSSETILFFLCVLINISALIGLKWGIVGWSGFIMSLAILVPNILDPSSNPVMHPFMYWTIFISLSLTLLSTAQRFKEQV